MVFYCKSTAVERSINAKNAKQAADIFVNEMLMNCYKFKLKKVTEGTAKLSPDFSVAVSIPGESKITYFQYTNLKPKNSTSF